MTTIPSHLIINILDSVEFTRFVHQQTASHQIIHNGAGSDDNEFGSRISSPNSSIIRPYLTSNITNKIHELKLPRLSHTLHEWIDDELKVRLAALPVTSVNYLSNHKPTTDMHPKNVNIIPIARSISNSSEKPQIASQIITRQQPLSAVSTVSNTAANILPECSNDKPHTRESPLTKLAGNEKFLVMESRLKGDDKAVTSTIGFASTTSSTNISTVLSSSSPGLSTLVATKKKISVRSVPTISNINNNKEVTLLEVTKTSTRDVHHCKTVIVKNLAFLYSSLLLGKPEFVHKKHFSSEEMLSAATVATMERITLAQFIALIHKLVRVVSEIPVSNQTLCINNLTFFQDSDWSIFLLLLVEMLLPVVKSLGKNVIEMILQCKVFASWKYRSFLKDQLDANLIPSEHANQDRLYSYLAENYTKPFADEDNRHEQKSKEEKDLYKNRSDINDKFLNLFQEFRSVKMRDPVNATNELTQFFIGSFHTIGSDILNMDPRNMQWFARMFVGLYLHYCLLPQEFSKKSDPFNRPMDPHEASRSLNETKFIPKDEASDKQDSAFTTTATKTPHGSKKLSLRSLEGRKNCGNFDGFPSFTYTKEYEFNGVLIFFSHFVLHFNNYLFNQCLTSVAIQELNHIGTQQSSNRILSNDSINASNTGTANLSSGSNESLDVNSFTLSTLMAKNLGKLLGLIHFHHYALCMQLWEKAASSFFSNPGPLPLNEIIISGVQKGRLSQIIPWVTEFLKMATPVVEQMVQLNIANSSNVGLGYLSTFKLLSILPCHHDLDLWNEDFSTNKMLVLIELQQLWAAIPLCVLDIVMRSFNGPSVEPNDLPFKIIAERLLHTRSCGPCLDRENFALSGISMRLLTPALDFSATGSKMSNESTEGKIAKEETDISTKQKPPTAKKRREVIPLQQIQSNNTNSTPITPIQNTLGLVPASPLSTTSKGSLRIASTSKKGQPPRTPNQLLMQPINTSLDKSNKNQAAFIRNFSASEIRLKSPFKLPWSGNGSTTLHGLTPHYSHNVMADSRTPLAKNLFSEQGDNNNPFELNDSINFQHQDILDKMDDAFWNYNRDLCDIHKFLIFFMRVIGKERVQDHVCIGIHALSRRLDQTEFENDYSQITQRVNEEVYNGGETAISRLYDHVCQSLSPQLYALYSKSSHRTVQLACFKTKQQLQCQRYFLLLHLKEYAQRKLQEVQETKSRKFESSAMAVETKSDDRLQSHNQVAMVMTNSNILEQECREDERMKTIEDLRQKIQKQLTLLKKSGFIVDKTEESKALNMEDFNIILDSLAVESQAKSTFKYSHIGNYTSLAKTLPIVCNVAGTICQSTAVLCSIWVTSSLDTDTSNRSQYLMYYQQVRVLMHAIALLLEKTQLLSGIRDDLLEPSRIELSKFLLAILLPSMVLDLLFVKHMDQCAVSSPRLFVLDSLALIIKQGWVNKESLHKIVTMVGREKSGAFFQHCRGFDDISKNLRKGLCLFYHRLVLHLKVLHGDTVFPTCDGTFDMMQSPPYGDVISCLGEKHGELFKSLIDRQNR